MADGGLPAFLCPVSGLPVWDGDGFDEDADHSPCLRFFIDWVGQVWVHEDVLADDDGWRDGYMAEVVRVWRDPGGGTQNERVEQCLRLLPRSAVVFEVLDPPRGPKAGTVCYACFDFEPYTLPRGLDELESLEPRKLRRV